MLKNYFRIAWRNLSKNKVFSFINVFGLAAGLTCCMLIAVYVYQELHYDTGPQQSKQIYRVGLHLTENGTVNDFPMVDMAVGQGIKEAFPEVQSTTRLTKAPDLFVRYNDKQFKETKLAFADNNFLSTFSIPFAEGDAANALKEPNTIVVSKQFAEKYFGAEPALGKLLTTTGYQAGTYKVTGIINKVPDNTHFHFDAFISTATLQEYLTHQTWSNVGWYTYLVLNKDADAKGLQAKFPQLVEKHVVPEIQRDMGVSLEDARKSVNSFLFTLQPLTDIHLHGNTRYELEPNGDISYVYIFSALAIFILLLACVNFTNLSTAGASKRAKEVGIRKVVGSLKSQLVAQFLMESVLLTFGSLLLSYLLVYMLLPYYNQLTGRAIDFRFFLSAKFILSIMAIGLFAGLLAGIYPAFFLSSFNTIKVLKGANFMQSGKRNLLRSSLVVFQFTVSTALIIATIIVYRQLSFMQNKKLGYDKEQVLVIQDANNLGRNQHAFKQQLLADSRVINATVSGAVPAGGANFDGTQIFVKDKANHSNIQSTIFWIDDSYLTTLGMKMLKGRNFSSAFPSDSSAVIINESAVHDLGLTAADALNKTIVRSGQHEFKIIGVVQDFHFASARKKIAPVMLLLGNGGNALMVKMKAKDINGFLADTKKQWATFNTGTPFNYTFLDERFASVYDAEKRTGQIFSVFAALAILIASLGLFGLAAFTIEQRRKEIGIRKVLGASLQNLLTLVSKEFMVLVGIAFMIAIPLSWVAMHQWLEGFAYRVEISWWMFAVAGILSVVIALFTISFRAIRAGLANPVKSLRSE